MKKFKIPARLILAILTVLTSMQLKAQNNKSGDVKKDRLNNALLSYEKYIDENRDAHLKEYLEFVSIPSISSMPSHRPDIERAASWIVKKLKAIGMTTAEIIPTKGLPVVYGSWDKAPGKPTVLIYAHYDVQPVKEAEWENPPFAPVIRNERIFGRGAADDKSGVMIAIWAVEAMLSRDKSLPVNVKLVFEGEEEDGSPNFHDFLASNKELLKADFALNTDAGQRSDTVPAMIMSLRGIAELEFHVKTANFDAHSGGYGGKTPNAAKAMAEIIASFYNKDGSVAVDGFYNHVLPLSSQEREMIKKVPYDAADDMKILGTTAETGDTNYMPLERVWYRPTLEINGMQGGYTAVEGFSNIIPGTAMCRLSCRLVYNQSGKEVIDMIVKHINKYALAGSTITYNRKENYSIPIKFPSDTKAYHSVSDALTQIYGRPPLQIAMGGSNSSLIDFKEQLGLYAYSLGFGQKDEKQHAANEFMRISDLRKGQLVYCYYLQNISQQESSH
jgi:acetylornithine deacetylase/succinyl-diaminopimelate desuccinylase-like protein